MATTGPPVDYDKKADAKADPKAEAAATAAADAPNVPREKKT